MTRQGIETRRDRENIITPAGVRALKKSGISACALSASLFLCFPLSVCLRLSSYPVVQRHYSLLGALYYCCYPLSSSRILPSSHLHTEPHRALCLPLCQAQIQSQSPKTPPTTVAGYTLLQHFDFFLFLALHSPSASRLLQNKRASSLFFPFRLIRWWIGSCLVCSLPPDSLLPPTSSLVLRQLLLTKHLSYFFFFFRWSYCYLWTALHPLLIADNQRSRRPLHPRLTC